MSHYLDIEGSNFMSDYKVIRHSSNVSQSSVGTSSWTDMTGSEISYIPSPGSTYVIYEYSFHLGRSGSDNDIYMGTNFSYSTDDGSSWNDYDNNTRVVIGSISDKIRRRGPHIIKLCLDNWGNSERLLKMQCKRYSNSYNFLLHQLTEHFSEGDDDTSYYRPIVSCYSIT